MQRIRQSTVRGLLLSIVLIAPGCASFDVSGGPPGFPQAPQPIVAFPTAPNAPPAGNPQFLTPSELAAIIAALL